MSLPLATAGKSKTTHISAPEGTVCGRPTSRGIIDAGTGTTTDVTCKACERSVEYRLEDSANAAAATEQAATPAPAVPTIEELETELAAANAAEDAALESGAGREVMRAARDRFTAAHQALQDARRADFRRERGYTEEAEPEQVAAPDPAAKEEIHGNDSTKKLARLAGVTTAAFNEQARDLGVPMHYSENRRCWAIINRAQAASLVKMISDNPDKPV